jgi:DNA modification methylase
MAAHQLTLIAVADLKDDPDNARTHSEAQIEHVAGLIERFGWTRPLQVDVGAGNLIVVGHGARRAAERIYAAGGTIYLAPGKDRGGKALPRGKVPAMDVTGWTDEERRAVNIADNRAGEMSEWDYSKLLGQIGELASASLEIEILGFDQTELAAMARGVETRSGRTDPESVPDEPEIPVSRPGDVWIMGNHRLICGDSTDAGTVETLLAGAKPHLMVTDPPYGVEYDPSWRAKVGVNKNTKKMGKVLNDDRADWREAWALFPGDVAYVWHASLFTREVLNSLESCKFAHRSMIIWVKDRFTLGRGDYHWQHEPCWYVVREGRKGHYVGGRSQSTTWTIPARDDSGVGHGTQKPLECMKRPIENNSKPGDAVYEPFSGSGTTIIAGEMTGRRIYAIELNPTYVDVGVCRWQAFTGEEAVLEGDGRTFAEIAAERVGAAATEPA